MDTKDFSEGRLPTLHVVAENIPQAYFRAMKAVWEQGFPMRTEYDRKDESGKYIDPPSRDARVLIEVKDPFSQPRYPPISFCEIGTYIAEIMGVKDHMVVPIEKLREAVHGELSAKEWPYTYHQRLFSHPAWDGSTVDQVARAIDRISKTPYTRRAVATTAVPDIDVFLKEDVPCLREIQLRCPEDHQGNWVLNMNTVWRSRDLYKAWPDNVIAITFLQSVIAEKIAEKAGKNVRVGSYADYSFAMHIYGQDFGAVGGDARRGLKSFFENFTEESFVARSLTSEQAAEMLVLPQLKNLLTEPKIQEWRFPETALTTLRTLVNEIETGKRQV
ncbi:MAG TPA: thymidylate synthase [Candidatus Hydrogenedentes bacterium]|nr:thymidylate synthase [Candidatus Hydrogenedentota bacterium]HOL75640.1 thymidylate synthase [Candidatus Hydrogenedentota bacterium]HPO84367.1 thymidylate synthase [Candidatus Hydrogenedentota bacterium]